MLLLIVLVPTRLFAAPAVAGTAIPVLSTSESAIIDAMVNRLNEIQINQA